MIAIFSRSKLVMMKSIWNVIVINASCITSFLLVDLIDWVLSLLLHDEQRFVDWQSCDESFQTDVSRKQGD